MNNEATGTGPSPQQLSARVGAKPAKLASPKTSILGRYKVIVIAVAFFLVFDLGVLILNFYTSFKISEDALSVNLAGRQRMLSQRMTKALLTVEIERSKVNPQDVLQDKTAEKAAFDELAAAVALFDGTFVAFKNGGTVTGGDGKPAQLNAADSAGAQNVLAREALTNAEPVWLQYKTLAKPIASGQFSTAELSEAVAFARQNNVRLLGLMNQLTTALEASAAQRANNLRLVQTIGIVLALLNFAYILYKFLRSLRQADAALEIADAENKDILRSVREGLFLLEPDARIGTQVSASAGKLLGCNLMPGDSFLTLLQPLVSEKALRDATDYVQLLFQPHIKESLVQSINPLDELELTVNGAKRHVSVSFNRVIEQGAVRHLLVTMQDVSERIALQGQIKTERELGAQEFAFLVNAFRLSHRDLDDFLQRSADALTQVNAVFRADSKGNAGAQGADFDKAARLLHTIKGEASALDLRLLVHSTHKLEEKVQDLKRADNPQNNLVAILVALDELMGRVQSIQSLNQSRESTAAPQATEVALATIERAADALPAQTSPAQKLLGLLERMGQELGKQYKATLYWPSGILPELHAQAAQDIAIQLARNAAVHGIELPADRMRVGKAAEGQIDVHVSTNAQNQCVLRVRDDGAGINPAALRERLKSLAWYTAAQLEAMTDQQVTAHIMKPGFSTSAVAHEHAGRGVGLDVVNQLAKNAGARLQVGTQVGHYTEFRIVWPALAAVAGAVA